MRAISARDYEKNIEHLATDAYAKHVIRRVLPAGYYICRPHKDGGWDCRFATEIQFLGFGRILIHGDGPDLLFGRSSYSGERLIPWLACSELDYLASKVVAGTAWTWDSDVARGWLAGEIVDAESELRESQDEEFGVDEKHQTIYAKRRDGLIEIRDRLDDIDEHKLHEELYELSDGDCEWGMHAGRVVHPDVVYAREAVRTLRRLLGRTEAA